VIVVQLFGDLPVRQLRLRFKTFAIKSRFFSAVRWRR
jgi:hypothetical protein